MDLSKSKQVGRFGKRKKGAVKFPENELQKACEEICHLYNITFIRIPDQVYNFIYNSTKIPEYVKVLIFKYLKNLPDLTLLFESGKYHCCELKSDKGRLRPGQKLFRNMVGELNYTVIRDAQTFANIVHEMRK